MTEALKFGVCLIENNIISFFLFYLFIKVIYFFLNIYIFSTIYFKDNI